MFTKEADDFKELRNLLNKTVQMHTYSLNEGIERDT